MKKIFLFTLLIFVSSCSSPKFINDFSSLKSYDEISTSSKIDLNNWHNLDPELDTIPGTSVERAHKELLEGLKGKKVIVAVIDTGLDIEHESLSNNIWINKNEKINGKDDDNNGYIDDINGWNYLGAAYDETRDTTRIFN